MQETAGKFSSGMSYALKTRDKKILILLSYKYTNIPAA